MKIVPLRIVAGFAVMFALSSPAHAGVIVDEETAMRGAAMGISPLTITTAPIITHVGNPEPSPAVVRGTGTRVLLGKALKIITPSEWTGFVEDVRVRQVGVVSFNGGNRPWTLVLEELLVQNSLAATIDWNKKELAIRVGPNFQGN